VSLSTKGSRPITVDDEPYRWAVSPDSGYSVLVVQSAKGNGAKLLVSMDWLAVDANASVNEELGNLLRVTPGLVVTVVRQALANGWEPTGTGRDFTCRLKADGSIDVHAAG